MGETLALIDNLPPGRGLLAIGLSPNRLITAPTTDASQISGSPLALTSPHLAAELASRVSLYRPLPGLLTGIFHFAASYLDGRLLMGSPDLQSITYDRHYYAAGPVASLSAKKTGSAIELARERPQYAANIAYNLSVLAEVVRLGRAKGYAVTFFEQPLGPEASGPEWDAYLATYRADVAGVSRKLKVPDVAVQAQAKLRSDDFADLFHLVDTGRDKWTPPFARGIAHVLQQAGEPALGSRHGTAKTVQNL